MIENFFLRMCLLAEISLLTVKSRHSTISYQNLRAKHGPVSQLAIFQERCSTHISLIMCHSTLRGTWTLAGLANVDSVRLQFLCAQSQVPTWAHLRENCPHSLQEALRVHLLCHCQRAVRITTKAEQQLHHLTECCVAGNRELIKVSLTDSALRCGDLAYVHAENRRFCLF